MEKISNKIYELKDRLAKHLENLFKKNPNKTIEFSPRIPVGEYDTCTVHYEEEYGLMYSEHSINDSISVSASDFCVEDIMHMIEQFEEYEIEEKKYHVLCGSAVCKAFLEGGVEEVLEAIEDSEPYALLIISEFEEPSKVLEQYDGWPTYCFLTEEEYKSILSA